MDDLYSAVKIINSYLNLVFKAGLVIVVLASFFLFTTFTSEMYDTPKLLVLLAFTGILLILLAFRYTILGKVVLTRTYLDLPLLILLAVSIASTVLSSSPYVSLLGNQLKVSDSLISIILLVLFYFVLVNNLKNNKEIKWIFSIILIAAEVLATITLLSYAGVKLLPPPWITGANFTPAGSSFTTSAVLAILLPFVLVQLFRSTKPLYIALYSLFFALSGVTIALTGTWASWIAGLFAIVLTFLVASPVKDLSKITQIKPLNLVGLAVPVVIIALVAILSFVPPIGNAKNPLYTAAQNFPREVQLPLVTSWKISVSAFRDSPFWGTGPSTYLFDFTNYKPVEFNSSKFWNLRFDTSFNEYLQVLATIGIIGLLALLSLTAVFISSSYATLTSPLNEQDFTAEFKKALAVAGLAFFVILALHAATLVIWIIGLIVLASFMVIYVSENAQKGSSNNKNMLVRIAANITNQSSSQEIKVDALPGVLLTILLAAVIFVFYFGGKFVLADYHHRLASNALSANQAIVAYNELFAAEKLNPYNDVYRINFAQTNFILANAIALAKGPTEASPSGTFTDQDKQNIQVLLQQSINEARAATTLSPKSAANWEILGLLYRQIAGVAQNALVFALDSYGRAILQDPLNPVLRVSVGGVYYAVKSYDMATRFFTDAVNIKPDYANGYFNLSVTLKDKGDLANAQAMAEKTMTLIDKSSPDYKTVSDYIEDLKNKIASQAQPPASQTSGALQDQNLPKLPVSGLEKKPEKIATPEAVKKPSPTPAATTTPTTNP